MFRRISASALTVAAAIAALGCATTLQTPTVLEPGQVSLGASVATVLQSNGVLAPLPGIVGGVRVGVANGVDLGVKLEGPFPTGVTVDAKFEVVRAGSLLVAVDVGAAWIANDLIGLVPMVLVGTERFYGGARVGAAVALGSAEVRLAPEVIAGASFGHAVALQIEASAIGPFLTVPADATPVWDYLLVGRLGVGVSFLIDP